MSISAPEAIVTDLKREIDRLRSEICPERFKYTHEFLQLASVAALREGEEWDEGPTIVTLAQSTVRH